MNTYFCGVALYNRIVTRAVKFYIKTGQLEGYRVQVPNNFFVDISMYSVIGYVVCNCGAFLKGQHTRAAAECGLIMNSALARFQPTMVHSRPGHVRPRRPSCLLYV